jgi:hypothetical protein
MIGTVNNSGLTNTSMAAIPPTLSPHVAVRGESRKKHKMPIARLIHRLRFHMQKSSMVGVIRGASARMVLVPCLSTRITFTARFLRESSGVLKHSQEVNTMSQNNSAQNSEQNKTSEYLLTQLQQSIDDAKSYFVLELKTNEFSPRAKIGQRLMMSIDCRAEDGDLVAVKAGDKYRVDWYSPDREYYAVCVAIMAKRPSKQPELQA